IFRECRGFCARSKTLTSSAKTAVADDPTSVPPPSRGLLGDRAPSRRRIPQKISRDNFAWLRYFQHKSLEKRESGKVEGRGAPVEAAPHRRAALFRFTAFREEATAQSILTRRTLLLGKEAPALTPIRGKTFG